MDRESGGANSNTALFLMELIVVIGFFSLVAVICVRLFVAASAASSDSVDVNHATRTAESFIEAWTACEGDLREVNGLYPDAVLQMDGENGTDGVMTLWFDGEWEPVASKDMSVYYLTLSARETDAAGLYGGGASGATLAATVTARRTADDEIFVTFDADHYIGAPLR